VVSTGRAFERWYKEVWVYVLCPCDYQERDAMNYTLPVKYSEGYQMSKVLYRLQSARPHAKNVGDLLQILVLMEYILTK
jgi:hypothetical protein